MDLEVKDNKITVLTQLPQEGFLRLPQVLQTLAISKSTFWRGVKAGCYPRPVKIGPRVSVWRVDDIREVVKNIAAQNAKN